jgi:hypothetical protein
MCCGGGPGDRNEDGRSKALKATIIDMGALAR